MTPSSQSADRVDNGGARPSGQALAVPAEPFGLDAPRFDPSRGLRVLVCGGRDFTDCERVFRVLDELDARHPIALVIEGGQRTRHPKLGLIGGADLWACRWTYARGRPGMRFDAEWSKHGKAAGPIRNRRMIEEGKPDLIVAFPGGSGTADMVRQGREAGIAIQHEILVEA